MNPEEVIFFVSTPIGKRSPFYSTQNINFMGFVFQVEIKHWTRNSKKKHSATAEISVFSIFPSDIEDLRLPALLKPSSHLLLQSCGTSLAPGLLVPKTGIFLCEAKANASALPHMSENRDPLSSICSLLCDPDVHLPLPKRSPQLLQHSTVMSLLGWAGSSRSILLSPELCLLSRSAPGAWRPAAAGYLPIAAST